jgi:hypothetical protein
MYEVRSISHSGGESLPAGGGGEIQILDLSKMMDRFIDLLDAWVDRGVAPPPTRSDWAELGDADRDGALAYPALAFPEVTCSLGVYFPFPAGTSTTTAFAAFSGRGLEPLDANKVFVDMNRNGVWDYRETPAPAWQRPGLPRKGEPLTPEKYASCVQAAAELLHAYGFFSDATARWYAEEATKAEIDPKPAAR